jgi:hypothetical protein
MSEGVASKVGVGLEIGKISGRLVALHMAWTTCSVTVPSTVDVASRIVVAAPSMVSSNPTGPDPIAQGRSERFLA